MEQERVVHTADNKEYLLFLVGCQGSSGTLKLLENGLTTARECKAAIVSDSDANEQDGGIGSLQNQLADSDKKLAELKEKISSVESAQFQANDTIASINARMPGLEEQKKAHAKARRFKQAGAVSKQIKLLKDEQIKAQAAIATAKQDLDTFNQEYQQEEAATGGLRTQLATLQQELKERKSVEDMKAIERLRLDVAGIAAIESKLSSLEAQEETAEHVDTHRPLQYVLKLATEALASERALLEKELSALCDRQNVAHLKDISDVNSKLPADLVSLILDGRFISLSIHLVCLIFLTVISYFISSGLFTRQVVFVLLIAYCLVRALHPHPKDVDIDMNVDDGSTPDPAADVARLAEIEAQIAELDSKIQAAAASDDYELADTLDSKQRALKDERGAVTGRLAEARATAVENKAQHEKELSALEGEVEAAASAEDYDRAAELEEKADEVK